MTWPCYWTPGSSAIVRATVDAKTPERSLCSPPRGTGQTAGVSFVPAHLRLVRRYSASSSDIRPPSNCAKRFALTSVGSRIAVRGLHQAGPIHQTSDGLVFASQAALHVVQMVGHVI